MFYSYYSTSINIKIKNKVNFRMLKGILIVSSVVEKNTFHVVKFSVVKLSFLQWSKVFCSKVKYFFIREGGTLLSTLHRRKLCHIYYLFYWMDRERGDRSNCNLKFWIVKRENRKGSGPAGIEVRRIFGPNSLCSFFGPLVAHPWKDTTTFGLILAFKDMVQWCVKYTCQNF